MPKTRIPSPLSLLLRNEEKKLPPKGQPTRRRDDSAAAVATCNMDKGEKKKVGKSCFPPLYAIGDRLLSHFNLPLSIDAIPSGLEFTRYKPQK